MEVKRANEGMSSHEAFFNKYRGIFIGERRPRQQEDEDRTSKTFEAYEVPTWDAKPLADFLLDAAAVNAKVITSVPLSSKANAVVILEIEK